MEEIELCIIDDHKIVRQGLKRLLESTGNYKVTHEFESGIDFLNALPLQPPPHVYILDESMPHMRGIEVLQELDELPDDFKVLFLSQHVDERIIANAFQYGARGFLNKSCTIEELTGVINSIAFNGYHNIKDILKLVKNTIYYPKKQFELNLPS
jgi:DNA-binding NarL/FixJ family response regulator